MSAASSLPAVIDALLAALRAPGTVQVYDGLWPTDAAPTQYLMVGVSDPTDDDIIDAATSTQEWSYLGHDSRNETTTIHCVAVAYRGDNDMAACRLAAADVLKLATDLVVNDPSLSGSTLMVTGISGVSLRQGYDDQGVIVNIPFDIQCQARLAD